MVYDFTLVHALDAVMGSQEHVLRPVVDSDCAEATVGWGGNGAARGPQNSQVSSRVARRLAQLRSPTDSASRSL